MNPVGCRWLQRSILIVVWLGLIGCGTLSHAGPPTVVCADEAADSIWVRLLFGAGSVYDPSGKEGLARLTASVLTRSAPPSGEIRINVDRDVAIVDGRCPAGDWPTFAGAFAATVTHPDFDSLDARLLTARQLASLDSVRLDDLALARAALQYYSHRNHPYGHPPEGFDSTTRALTIAEAREFRNRHYTRNNYVLGLAGAVPTTAADDIHAALRRLPNRGRPRLPRLPDPAASGQSVRIIECPECDQATVVIGLPILTRRGDSAYAALQMTAALLVRPGTPGGRFDRLLRDERRLVGRLFATVGVDVDRSLPRRQECFTVGMKTSPVNCAFLLNMLIRELADLSQHGLPNAELANARAQAARNRQWVGPPAWERMRTGLADRWLGVQDEMEKPVDEASQITVGAVRCAARALDISNLTVVAIVPDAQALATQLLAGPITCEYPAEVDQQRVRADDRRYLANPPRWDTDRMRIVQADEMFR